MAKVIKTEKCPKCHGHGRLKVCPECNGEGGIVVAIDGKPVKPKKRKKAK
jgi:DnaJ-class molecular chaperone